jgi:hypothetical protein
MNQRLIYGWRTEFNRQRLDMHESEKKEKQAGVRLQLLPLTPCSCWIDQVHFANIAVRRIR